MPTSKKSTKNIVATTNLSKYKVQTNGIVKQLGGGYFSFTNTIYNIFTTLYRNGEASATAVVYRSNFRVVSFPATKNSLGGFTIGCNEFDAKAARNFFRLVGVPTKLINQHFPKAKAAAAGF